MAEGLRRCNHCFRFLTISIIISWRTFFTQVHTPVVPIRVIAFVTEGAVAMKHVVVVCVVILFVGCMETRYARSSNVTSVGVGNGAAGITSQGEMEARQWSGPYVGQPNMVHP